MFCKLTDAEFLYVPSLLKLVFLEFNVPIPSVLPYPTLSYLACVLYTHDRLIRFSGAFAIFCVIVFKQRFPLPSLLPFVYLILPSYSPFGSTYKKQKRGKKRTVYVWIITHVLTEDRYRPSDMKKTKLF